MFSGGMLVRVLVLPATLWVAWLVLCSRSATAESLDWEWRIGRASACLIRIT